MRVPKRSSLVSETAAVIREGIEGGEFGGCLPGERSLCSRLQVSRSTLRAALRLLENQKLITAGMGRPRQIRRTGLASAVPRIDCIGLLTLQPLIAQRAYATYYVNSIREHLQDAGLRLQVHVDPRLGRPRPHRYLESLLRESRTAGWLLLRVPAAVQQWFQERGHPALVVGSCHEGVQLPSFDLDLRAVCRHAAGLLRSRGHRRIAFVRNLLDSAGMKASEEGFLEGAAAAGAETSVAQLIGHNGTADSICRNLARVLRSQQAPTGLLVADAGHALCVVSYLISQHLSIPGDVSVISRDNDELLEFFRPAISRYSIPKPLFASRLARFATDLAMQGSLPVRNYRLLPKLIEGATLGKVSEVGSHPDRPIIA